MNPVIHFELPSEDRERVKKFYADAFGWQMQQLGPEMGNYVVVTTTEVDEHGRPKQPGAINGGIYAKSKDNQLPTIVIAVQNIKEHMQKVEAAGGKILGGQKIGEPDDIPGVGKYIAVADSEGNRIALLEPIMPS